MLFMEDQKKKKKSRERKCKAVFASDIEINNNNSSNAPHNTQRNKIDKESENKSPSRNLFIAYI